MKFTTRSTQKTAKSLRTSSRLCEYERNGSPVSILNTNPSKFPVLNQSLNEFEFYK